MTLLDVNALMALAWDSHVHHVPVLEWFQAHAASGWETCPATESGFVRVSSNPAALPAPIAPADARAVLVALRLIGAHRFLEDDVSPTDEDFPEITGHRQVSDAHLLVLARRRGVRLLTFDAALRAFGGAGDVELLRTL